MTWNDLMRRVSQALPGPAVWLRVVTIVPDTKDWTWVLQRPCPECGLDTQGFPREAIAGMVRVNAAAWLGVLAGPGDVRRRPAPGVWSALEYGCHVCDVLWLNDERLRLMLMLEAPRYPNWDQDATAVADRYAEQDPAVVAAGLREAADVIAERFEGLSSDQWQRAGSRSDGAQFTVESFARYFIHDPIHHLYDVTSARYDRRPTGG
jgi:DinB superfamily